MRMGDWAKFSTSIGDRVEVRDEPVVDVVGFVKVEQGRGSKAC